MNNNNQYVRSYCQQVKRKTHKLFLNAHIIEDNKNLFVRLRIYHQQTINIALNTLI